MAYRQHTSGTFLLVLTSKIFIATGKKPTITGKVRGRGTMGF